MSTGDWYNEIANVPPQNYTPQSLPISHATQVLWKNSTQLGCAIRLCGTQIPGGWPVQYGGGVQLPGTRQFILYIDGPDASRHGFSTALPTCDILIGAQPGWVVAI